MNDHQVNSTYSFKVLLMGEADIGKSSLITRYAENIFSTNYFPTIGLDSKKKTEIIEGDMVHLTVCDSAGQERLRAITKSSMNNSEGIILCFDIANRRSFTEINEFWLKWVQDYRITDRERGYISKLFLVGTKSDLEDSRVVTIEEAQLYAKEIGASYYETSALQDKQVQELFHGIAAELRNEIKENQKRHETFSIQSVNQKSMKKYKYSDCKC